MKTRVIKDGYGAIQGRGEDQFPIVRSSCSRRRRQQWAILRKKVWNIDALKCPKCGGEMKVISFIEQPSVNEQLISRLASLNFISEGTNVLLLGPPGVGKTHLAVGLAVKPIDAGNRVYFFTMSNLCRKYRSYSLRGHKDRLLTVFARPEILIIDEVGYIKLDQDESVFFFDLIAMRYQKRKSIIITSNKSWGSWGEILPDRVMASAILDRLLHYSVTLNIQGQSSD